MHNSTNPIQFKNAEFWKIEAGHFEMKSLSKSRQGKIYSLFYDYAEMRWICDCKDATKNENIHCKHSVIMDAYCLACEKRQAATDNKALVSMQKKINMLLLFHEQQATQSTILSLQKDLEIARLRRQIEKQATQIASLEAKNNIKIDIEVSKSEVKATTRRQPEHNIVQTSLNRWRVDAHQIQAIENNIIGCECGKQSCKYVAILSKYFASNASQEEEQQPEQIERENGQVVGAIINGHRVQVDPATRVPTACDCGESDCDHIAGAILALAM